MTKESILLVGAGGHAKACIDVIEQEGRYSVAGLVGQAHEVGGRVFGYPMLGTDADLGALLDAHEYALIVVGQIKNHEPRKRLFSLIEQSRCNLPVIVSPRAYVSPHAKIGKGTIVMHGAIVNAGADVGCNCILNSQSLIEHDSVIGDHCHISTGAVINGGVSIGSGTFIGSRSSIRQGVNIGERCVIGMAQSVLVDCEAGIQLPASGGMS